MSAPAKRIAKGHDGLEVLSSNRHLLCLLEHYANLGGADRQAWQDRLMTMEGVECSKLAKLHGQLIAFAWIEQNTGNTPVLRAGFVPACYRATSAGINAVLHVRRTAAVDDSEAESSEKEPVATMAT